MIIVNAGLIQDTPPRDLQDVKIMVAVIVIGNTKTYVLWNTLLHRWQ